MITAKSVNKANEEIDGLTDEQLDQAIDRLFGDQPEVLKFLEGYGLGDGEIQELAILLTYFVFKASEAENPGKAATVKREDFESVFELFDLPPTLGCQDLPPTKGVGLSQ